MTEEINGGIVLTETEVVKAPVSVTNFLTLDVPKFKERKPIKEHRLIVLHENAGSIIASTLYSWLNKKGYGYHFIVWPNGSTTQHAPLDRRLYHAGRANPWSIGVCCINPYYPKLVDSEEEKKLFELIPAPWYIHKSPKTDARYSKPTEEQIETTAFLVAFLCDVLKIPTDFPTAFLSQKQRKIKNWRLPGRLPDGPGIVAHRDFSGHSDGRYQLERLIEIYKN